MVDVVPEALARALRTWPFFGVPENPSAWIMRTFAPISRSMSSGASQSGIYLNSSDHGILPQRVI